MHSLKKGLLENGKWPNMLTEYVCGWTGIKLRSFILKLTAAIGNTGYSLAWYV
jgi:hypothetical protein